jgi:hypothetical protein
MTADDKRYVTVLVLGRPGTTARRFRISRRGLGLLALASLCAALGIGYVLGSRSVTRSAVTRVKPSAPVSVTAAAMGAQPPASAVPAVPPAANVAATDAGAPKVAEAAPGVEAAPAGEPLRMLRDGPNQRTLELYPFAADGSSRASAFKLLETAMACGSGHSQKPDAALVRVLLEAQHNFAKPIVLLGGRCPKHDDRPDSAAQHRAGRAADVRIGGVTSEQLMSWLVKRGVGGAGRYKRAGFVHIDVRAGAREQWEAEEPAPERAEPKRAAQPAAAAAEATTEAAAPAQAAEPAASRPEPAARDHAADAPEN